LGNRLYFIKGIVGQERLKVVGKHSPTRYTTYFETHARCMEKLKASGVVVFDGLELIQLDDGRLKIEGVVQCRGNLILSVYKALRLERTNTIPTVQTVRYSYNLSVAGQGNIFRYDDAHTHPGHSSKHHVHRFDPPGIENINSPFETGEDWPTLTEVLQEVDQYFWEKIFYCVNSCD